VIPGLHTQVNVIGALLLRETRTRFGDQQLGYLWALIGPMLIIATFVVLIAVGGRSVPDGMNPVAFIATGLIPFNLFGGARNKVESAVSSNKSLLYYPQVFPLDLAIARTTLEFATLTTVFAILLGGNSAWEGSFAIHSLLLTLSALLLAGLLGGAVGLCLSTAALFWKSTPHITAPLFRPLFFISGIFFTANELPTPALDILKYNPILHIIEMVREGWFTSYTSRVAEPGYVIWCTLGIGLLGLTLERIGRSRLEL
jgi:capsular polysaccharide transport system permease protein